MTPQIAGAVHEYEMACLALRGLAPSDRATGPRPETRTIPLGHA
jgi:hypothetical protein